MEWIFKQWASVFSYYSKHFCIWVLDNSEASICAYDFRRCIPTKYSSSKSSVLKIDKKTGVAKAKKNGTAKISVWYGNAKYSSITADGNGDLSVVAIKQWFNCRNTLTRELLLISCCKKNSASSWQRTFVRASFVLSSFFHPNYLHNWKICRTSDSALRCNSPEITFAHFSELQLNRQQPELIQALFIFFVNLFGTSNFL